MGVQPQQPHLVRTACCQPLFTFPGWFFMIMLFPVILPVCRCRSTFRLLRLYPVTGSTDFPVWILLDCCYTCCSYYITTRSVYSRFVVGCWLLPAGYVHTFVSALRFFTVTASRPGCYMDVYLYGCLPGYTFGCAADVGYRALHRCRYVYTHMPPRLRCGCYPFTAHTRPFALRLPY